MKQLNLSGFASLLKEDSSENNSIGVVYFNNYHRLSDNVKKLIIKLGAMSGDEVMDLLDRYDSRNIENSYCSDMRTVLISTLFFKWDVETDSKKSIPGACEHGVYDGICMDCEEEAAWDVYRNA